MINYNIETEILKIYKSLNSDTKLNLTQIGESYFIVSTKGLLKPLFYIDGFNLYLYTEIDIAFGLSINFESIDGNEQSICFNYENYPSTFLTDLKELFLWFNVQI